MSRKLRFFNDQINKAGVKSSVRPAMQPDIDLEELEVHYSCLYYRSILLFLKLIAILKEKMNNLLRTCLFSFQAKLREHENDLLEMNTNSEKLLQTYNELLEFKMVLSKVVSQFFENIELILPVIL